MSDSNIELTAKAIGVMIFLIAVFLFPYYHQIKSAENNFSNILSHFWLYLIPIALIFVICLVLYFVIKRILRLLVSAYQTIDYKITHRHDEEIAKQTEINEIENLIEKKLPIDQKKLTNYIERLKSKLKVCKAGQELYYFIPELKKRLAKATELLEELEKANAITDINNKTEQAEREFQEAEERKQQKLRQEENRKWKIERNLKINDYFEPKHIFYKEKLTEREIQVLIENDFLQRNEYCIYEKKFCQVLVKPILHHSVTHTFLVWGAKELLEDIKEVKNIEEHYTKDADITFKFRGKIYALEIETGNLLAKEEQLKGKLSYLNRKYPKRFMFIVSNRDLLSKYRKLGFSTPRTKVSENLRKMLGI